MISSPTTLDVHGLTKAFTPGHPVVNDVSLSLQPGQITCLLGPSGCGKTTTLRLIAGFERPDAGEIRLRGEVISSPTILVPPDRRRMGMVFQEYALFPHLTVEGNIEFGLAGWSRRDRRARTDELLQLLGITELRDRFPHQLSGGQQQRVALGRALAPRPELLLLDEPFANLDVALRHDLREEIFEVLRQSRIPVLLVTHDQEEALSVSDRLAVMSEGRIEQAGTPDDLYARPANKFIARFVGLASFLDGDRDSQKIVTELGSFPTTRIGVEACVCPHMSVLVRPDDVVLADTMCGIPASILRHCYHGTRKIHTLRLPSGQTVLATLHAKGCYQPGDTVPVIFTPQSVNLYSSPEEDLSGQTCAACGRV